MTTVMAMVVMGQLLLLLLLLLMGTKSKASPLQQISSRSSSTLQPKRPKWRRNAQ